MGNDEKWERKGLFHAVDLASNEYNRPSMLFEEALLLARNDGLHITMHCDVDQESPLDMSIKPSSMSTTAPGPNGLTMASMQ